VNEFKDLFGRLWQSWRWVAAQFVLTALLILVGIAWTRLPEKHVWQVALSLLLPLLLAISALELQAGTVRSLADDDGKRVKLVWGAMTLLVWIAVAWVAWALLDWCDDQIPPWAGYLNSQAPAHARARLFTYEHIVLWMTILEWVLRWVVMPAKVIPYAAASAQWGLRLPWRKVLHLLWNWRWWLAVVLAALASVWLPERFFTGMPSGTVSAQIWHVTLKLIAAYLLVVGIWVLLLGWVAVLFGRQKPLPENDEATELFKRLSESRRWVGAMFGWMLLWTVAERMEERFTGDNGWLIMLMVLMGALLVVLAVAAPVVLMRTLRSLLNDSGKRVRLVWGALSLLLWIVLALVVFASIEMMNNQFLEWLLGWMVIPAVFIPFAAPSAQWGLRLPWRRVVRLLCDWHWWLGALLAALVALLPELLSIGTWGRAVFAHNWSAELVMGASDLFKLGIWVLLLAWFAVLFGRQQPPTEEVLATVPVLTGPPEDSKQASVKLDLPESS
jgi:hypothetical protein